MPLHFDPPKHVFHFALTVDHECRALDSPEASTVEVLLLVRAVLAGNRGILVREEREREGVFFREALVAQFIVEAHPQDDRVLGFHAWERGAEAAGLPGASPR